MRNPTDMMSAAARFAEICEAYDVLSDCKWIQRLMYWRQ